MELTIKQLKRIVEKSWLTTKQQKELKRILEYGLNQDVKYKLRNVDNYKNKTSYGRYDNNKYALEATEKLNDAQALFFDYCKYLDNK
jgi:hypothetical protein